ncbi:MAG: GntR family transcriptional regulator [Pseudomonadota bacterium]
MTIEWNDDQPIYRQLKDRMISLILEGALGEGDALPSVRTVAVEYQINPLTASKAYQELAADGIVEKRRGLGMFVAPGVRKSLAVRERDAFLKEEWPLIQARMQRLGLTLDDLPKSTPKVKGDDAS